MSESPETTMTPEDVPTELAVMLGEALYDDAHEHCGEDGCYGGDRASYIKQARWLLADLLPATYRHWFAQAFGTPEEIAARAEQPSTPDDIADLCERARPGHHEQRVRAKVAEEITAEAEAVRVRAEDFINVLDQPARERLLARRWGMGRAAAIARGERP